MTKEIRVYYECLEQAAHFIKPILEQTDAFKKNLFEIKLIKLKGNFRFYSRLVAPIIYLKNPDILITVIENETEYPLFQLEISTAVFTEDHELQRFDGIVASIENNCIYGKLSPLHKLSSRPHGGNTKFNYLIPYKAIYEKFRKLSFHFEWPCDETGDVIVDSDYLSCPAAVKPLELFLQKLAEFVVVREINFPKWQTDFENELAKEKFFCQWMEELNTIDLPDLKIMNTSRMEWKNKEKKLYLKVNRCGHAMDPERGMLVYYGTVCDETVSVMLFDKNNDSWYKSTPKEKEIKKYLKQNGLKTARDYLHCFIFASGLYSNAAFVELSKKYEKSKANSLTIDLTKFLSENFLSLNKSLRTLFKFSKQFQIIDTNKQIRLKFVWKKFNTKNDFQEFPVITPIHIRTSFDEDDVTYISVHNVLKQNGYIIIAVSYPGAQGDRVVLAKVGTGRRQQRRYIDIISYLPESHSALQENKGEFTPASIQEEINELSKYKSEELYKKSIENFVKRFDTNTPPVFKIGVGFWANSRFSIERIQQLEIDQLDYFIFIKSDKTRWKVFSTGNTKLFSKTEGIVSLPRSYEVVDIET
jgi:hypothetical protein